MEENKWLRSYTVATWTMAAFTIVIAGIGYLQYRMYKASERPWIGHTTQQVMLNKETEKMIAVQWHYTNGGKAPALYNGTIPTEERHQL